MGRRSDRDRTCSPESAGSRKEKINYRGQTVNCLKHGFDWMYDKTCPYCDAERLVAKVKNAFFAGCDYGSKYAGDQYLGTPERQRGFDQWKPISRSQSLPDWSEVNASKERHIPRPGANPNYCMCGRHVNNEFHREAADDSREK